VLYVTNCAKVQRRRQSDRQTDRQTVRRRATCQSHRVAARSTKKCVTRSIENFDRRSVCRASRSATGAPSRLPRVNSAAATATAEKSLSASSLQRTRAIARQGNRRLPASHIVAAHFFSADRTENRSCIHPLMNATVCRRRAMISYNFKN